MNTLWLCVTIILMGFSVQAQINSTCNSNDSIILKGFMNGMESSIDGWASNSPNCCNWAGITCDFHGKVVKLELSNKKLIGYLPDSLKYLNNLKTLNLSSNLLQGPIPISIFQLPNLQILDLSRNLFLGCLPVSANLPMIQILDISDNNLKGPISSGLCLNSTEIRVLKLGDNYLNGEIPPEFEYCSSLEQLFLDGNYVSGIIPEYIFSLPKLSQLYLQDNNFTGDLHNSNDNDHNRTSNLVYLDVSSNWISGKLPDFFHTFPNLTYFAAYLNNLSGRLPFSLSNSPSISTLKLRNNLFVGSIDLNCSSMINLSFLDLSYNKLSGIIPDNLPSCTKLGIIYLDGNNLTGQIPESFKRFNSLSQLSVARCNLKNLSVSLKILQHCRNLTTLAITMSFKNEKMPYIDDLQFKSLENLLVRNCSLTGMIPVWLNSLTKLKILDLSCNRLTGQIPPFLQHLPSLLHLNLSNNFLSGVIPENLTRLPGLRFHNNSVWVSLELPIFTRRGMSGKKVPCTYGISFPRTLDLSNNSLTGPIWPEFGNLVSLEILNLKYNELSGNIPSNLANLSCIETMDLSHNDLSGEIPFSLVKLGMLSKFSVAYNKLTGIIPSGGQFSTFSISSFEGNPGLCGEFVLSCEKVQESLQSREFEIEEDLVISFPVFTGFGIGFLLSVLLLLVVPRIRGDTQRMDKFE